MIKKIGSILQSHKSTPKEVEKAYSSVFDNANKCVHCGEVIPEGRLSCPSCEEKAKEPYWKSAFMNTFLGGK